MINPTELVTLNVLILAGSPAADIARLDTFMQASQDDFRTDLEAASPALGNW